MVPSRLVVLAVVVGTISCTSAEVFRIDNAMRPQTHPDSVQFLAQEPARPYTVIALLNVSSDGYFGGRERMRKRLVREAALLGGDAVLLGIGSLIPGGSESNAVLSGKVIVFKREGEGAN